MLCMTSMAALPDEPRYQIKTVCEQTGIRPVTLRAWERRYRFLNPGRSDGNYRLYSERDVALLRWLKDQVDGGTAISAAVAKLKDLRRRHEWPEAPAVMPPPEAKGQNPPPQMAQKLYRALVTHDQPGAARLLRASQADFDIAAVCLHVITPALVEIGEAWHAGRIKIATEHFASQFIRGWLMALMHAYPFRPGKPRVLVGCAPGEFHEIGALMFALLLRREGYRVEYLGQDVPVDDLVSYARTEHPALVCLAAGNPRSARDLKDVESALARLRPRTRFGFAGRAFDLQPALRQQIPGKFLGPDVVLALSTVRDLLGV